jgi:hypothetical protein
MAVFHSEQQVRNTSPASAAAPCRLFAAVVAGLVILTQTGCMSSITNAALRNALLDSLNTVAFTSADERHRRKKEAPAEDDAEIASQDTAPEAIAAGPAPEPMSLDEAVERAVKRLSEMGEIDAATQATLLSMLESTKPEDWPAAIDAFAAALEANRPARPVLPAESRSQVIPVVHQDADASAESTAIATADAGAATEPETPAQPAAPARLVIEPAASSLESTAEALSVEAPVIDRPPAPPQDTSADVTPSASLEVRNSCFVSRVRGWGEVDRFPDQAFRPGQDLIVYFELENLAAQVTPEGHSTSIDTLLRLVSADGVELGRWSFPPVEETCRSPRRDYFARYLIRLPDDCPAGPGRMEISVSDRTAGASARSQLAVDVR